ASWAGARDRTDEHHVRSARVERRGRRNGQPRREGRVTDRRHENLLSDTVRAMRRSGIREMMDLADVADDSLHLEIGEPDFPTPPHVIRAAVQAMQDGQ